MTRAEFIARAVLRQAAPIGGVDVRRGLRGLWDFLEPRYCVERAIQLADALEAAKVAPWQETSNRGAADTDADAALIAICTEHDAK